MLPTKLEQALNYRWDNSNRKHLEKLLITELIELRRKVDGVEAAAIEVEAEPVAVTEPPRNKHADKIADKSWRAYDRDPGGLEEK